MSEERYNVPALARGIAILQGFGRDRPVMTMAEIARAHGLPRATAFRLINTLEDAGFLVRETNGQGYRLGAAVLSLGFSYLAGQDLPDLARPVLERLRDRTGASAHLAIRDGGHIVYLLRAPGQSALTSNIGVGTRLTAYGSTMGRALLQDVGEDELRALYGDEDFEQFTEQTPATIDALTALLREDAARGYVASRSFFEPGVASVAAPVRDAEGRVVAAVSVVRSESGFDTPSIADHVCEAAAEISRWLGHVPAIGAAAE